jgi:hypothetical protein
MTDRLLTDRQVVVEYATTVSIFRYRQGRDLVRTQLRVLVSEYLPALVPRRLMVSDTNSSRSHLRTSPIGVSTVCSRYRLKHGVASADVSSDLVIPHERCRESDVQDTTVRLRITHGCIAGVTAIVMRHRRPVLSGILKTSISE